MGAVYVLQEKNIQAVNVFKRSLKIYALLGDQKKVQYIMTQLETISAGTGIDLSVTKYFVNQWLQGKSVEKPCE